MKSLWETLHAKFSLQDSQRPAWHANGLESLAQKKNKNSLSLLSFTEHFKNKFCPQILFLVDL